MLLVKYLHQDSIVSIADLAEKLGTSHMTIRRDLDELEQQGKIKKLHGGAMLNKTAEDCKTDIQSRISINYAEKKQIGAAAVSLIKQRSAVFFDSGTTNLYVIDALPEQLEFTAITTGLVTNLRLCNKPHVHNIAIGGDIHKLSYSSVNSIALEQIANFHTDMAFITCKAVSIPEGTYERLLQMVDIKRKIIDNTEHVVLLADHNKFESKSLSLAVPMERIDIVITDHGTPEHTIAGLKEMGKEVIIA